LKQNFLWLTQNLKFSKVHFLESWYFQLSSLYERLLSHEESKELKPSKQKSLKWFQFLVSYHLAYTLQLAASKSYLL
jgi:hypothetical protein